MSVTNILLLIIAIMLADEFGHGLTMTVLMLTAVCVAYSEAKRAYKARKKKKR